MGSQKLLSSHCSRTYWTPTMERYFIDLMLEHLHSGSRIGHTFNKQAWTDMLSVFNAKFGSQYDKDVLKSRYKNLWKQFNDIKNLLSYNGFTWDEAQQMVVADGSVWDAYIKVHPEARPYKNKIVLHFSDLCLIYGYTVADGRYSRSSHDVDVEDEVQGMNLGDGNGIFAASSTEHSRTEWTPDMDEYLIELMLNQQERGYKQDNTFNKQAWTDMLGMFNAKFGPQHSKRVLRHRYRKLWKYCSDLTNLIKQEGFSWDEKQQMILADNDLWDDYIKVHPRARSYRMKTLPNYKNMVLLFGDSVVQQSQMDVLLDKDIQPKVKGTKAGNERVRTFWTPPMDRYLIDLLLEQVYKGNRIGQTFITQAWINMVASFNANFRSYYDKDVLKNRYKHLRKQYNDVKVLLEHGGFSWDEGREMVTAEDHLWDAYVKAHPDARSYRVKTVPSYHKLCIIYDRLDDFDGRYSRLARSIDRDVEVSVLMAGERKTGDCLGSVDTGLDWTPPMTSYLIDLILAQVHGVNKNDYTLEEEAWVHIISLFNEKFGVKYEKHMLENHYQSLMKQYFKISSLINHDGFAWDETQQMITADDHLWEAYIKEHPDATSYRDRVLDHYNHLCAIFGTAVVVDRKFSMDGRSSCETLEMDFDNNFLDINEVSGGLEVLGPETETSDQAKEQLMATSGLERPFKVQKTDKQCKQGACIEIEDLITKFVNKKGGKNDISIESAIEALQAIPDIDDDILLDGCDLLEDERKAKTFLALDATLRKKWLLRKLGRS